MAVDFLIERFERRGAAPAIVGPAARSSFDELAVDARRWMAELDRRGVGEGAVVRLDGEFSPTTVALLLALAARSAVVVPQARRVVDGARRAVVAQVGLDIRVDEAGVVLWEWADRQPSHALYRELADRRHPGLVLFSSGTSGEPKAAVHDFVPLLDKFRRPRPPLSTVAFLPFDHLGGLNTVLHALSNGAMVACPRDRSPEGVCRLVEQHGIALLPATPTFFNLLLLSGAHRRHDLGSLEVVSYGAEPMPQTTLDRLNAAFPSVRLQQTYGMVEIGAMRTKSRDDGSLWVKVGGEGYETRVVDGILQVRSPSTAIGYLNADLPVTADGWLETGDAVLQDGPYLRFLGRASDLINVGGEKVYPAEVEDAIQSLPEVREVAVHGEPNPLIGQAVCATVAPVAGSDSADVAAAVKARCRERLERFKVPARVEVVPELSHSARFKKPRSARGGT